MLKGVRSIKDITKKETSSIFTKAKPFSPETVTMIKLNEKNTSLNILHKVRISFMFEKAIHNFTNKQQLGNFKDTKPNLIKQGVL